MIPRGVLGGRTRGFPGRRRRGLGHGNPADLRPGRGARRRPSRRGTPFLGICLGTQIIFERSEEDGGVACIGLDARAACAGSGRPTRAIKVPQMGWNAVRRLRPHPVFEGIEDESEFYFVHSYYPGPADPADRLGETEYARRSPSPPWWAAATWWPRSSTPRNRARIGLRLLENFSQVGRPMLTKRIIPCLDIRNKA